MKTESHGVMKEYIKLFFFLVLTLLYFFPFLWQISEYIFN